MLRWISVVPPSMELARERRKVCCQRPSATAHRLPWVSWNAPRTLKSDLNGFQLMALFADMATGNSSDTEVLEATCCNGSNLFVSEGSKRDAVQKLLKGG